MITPDTKDWTWVLDRPCPDCGFDTQAFAREDAGALFRADVEQWREILTGRRLLRDRPAEDTWSPLEYACHVRDLFRIGDERVRLMLEESDPRFPNWDQDSTAIDEDYASQDPARVLEALTLWGNRVAGRLDGVRGGQWARPGTRGDGARFDVESFARYLIHDPIHHLWDVTDRRASSL
jgi:hypothetical protein